MTFEQHIIVFINNSFSAKQIKYFKRYYSDQFPKITTHYTIHPRDKDPRWKGEYQFSKYNIINTIHFKIDM